MMFPSISMVAALPPRSSTISNPTSPRMSSPSLLSQSSGQSPRLHSISSFGEHSCPEEKSDGLPDERSDEFQDFLFGSPEEKEMCPARYPFPQDERLSAPQTVATSSAAPIAQHHADSYTSFGDGAGTTATINMHGNLIQLSRFFNHSLSGRSGFLSVDLPGTPAPHLVQERAQALADHASSSPSVSVALCGLYMEEPMLQDDDERKPRVEFVRDRWPRLTFFSDGDEGYGGGGGKESPFTLSVQYLAREGTVFQQHVFERKTGRRGGGKEEEHVPVVPNVMIDTDVLIRQLDFTTADANSAPGDGSGEARGSGAGLYSTRFGLHGYSLVFDRHSVPEEEGHPRSAGLFPGAGQFGDGDGGRGERSPDDIVSLVLALFVNGVPQRIEEVENKWYKIAERDVAEAEYISSGRVEITLAYRLQITSSEERSNTNSSTSTWRSSLVPASDLWAMNEDLRRTPFGHLSLSPCPHENFVLRRNLGHVLSVCSVPISDEQRVPSDNCPAVAITCGDFAGHRLVTAASFYVFFFLLSVYQALRDSMGQLGSDTYNSLEYTVKVMERIRKTCKGHLRWVFEKAERGEHNCFETHYWATGNLIPGSTAASASSLSSKLGARLLTDTPFQFIKAAEFASTFKDDTFREHVRKCIRPWIKSLDELDMRKCFAFARPTGAFTAEYRLDDHVWIWKALRCIEELGFGAQLKPRTVKSRRKRTTRRSSGRRDRREQEGEEEEHGLSRDFSSGEAQRHILRRFTTENPVFMNQRMLAMSRSAAESRFLFFSRDTALFHDMNSVFFDVASEPSRGQNRLIAWDRTIEVQKHHEENQDTGWDNPLRYALAIILGKKGYAINNQRSAEDMCDVATAILLQSTSPSGLFPGQLDEVTKEPEMVQEKRTWNFYWHAAFEVPYVLLKHGKNRMPAINHNAQRTAIGPHIDPYMFETAASDLPDDMVGLNAIVAANNRRTGLAMKKTVPFNDLFDHRSIIEPADEWLYNYPAFLDFDPRLERFQPFELSHYFKLYDLLRSVSPDSELWDQTRASDWTQYDVARWLCELGSETWEVLRSFQERGGRFLDEKDVRGTVLDVARCGFMHYVQPEQHHHNHHHPRRNIRMMHTLQLKESLGKLRTAESAKKRLVWLPRVDDGSVVLCCLAAPSAEKPKLSSFFDRHVKAEKFLLDDIMSVLNMWETEFHLSYYQLVDKGRDELDVDGTMSHLEVDGFPGKGKKIDRAAVGFRFDGDFFDRYWTCHYLERKPGDDGLNEKELEDRLRDIIFDKRLPKADRDKPLWRQRKILELLLFDKMLEDMTQSANELLEAAKAKVQLDLGVRRGSSAAVLNARWDTLSDALTDSISLFKIDSDAYLSFREEWAMLERILQVLEEDLGENLEKIGSWQRREEDRGPERPRWTRNDERKYRSAVTKLEVSNGRRVQELERCRARIRSFGQSLTDRLDRVRDDLNLRGAEDIRLFTYITAFFLPLGFAVSIFSMSDGPPQWLPIVGAIAIAVVTLFITVVALINARKLELGFKAMINFPKRDSLGADSFPRKASIGSGQSQIVSSSQVKRNSASTAEEEKAERGAPGKGRILSFLTQRQGIRRARPLRSPV